MLKLVAVGGVTITALAAPNMVQLLDKPLRTYFDKLDKRARERELKRISRYIQSSGLVKQDYEHGLQLTDKAKKRLLAKDLNVISIPSQDLWDQTWRLCFYDIPENHKAGRDALSRTLRGLGCYQLQRSVWVHPYPFRDVISLIAAHNRLDQYITYLEANHIDNESALLKRFNLS